MYLSSLLLFVVFPSLLVAGEVMPLPLAGEVMPLLSNLKASLMSVVIEDYILILERVVISKSTAALVSIDV